MGICQAETPIREVKGGKKDTKISPDLIWKKKGNVY